MDIVDGLEKIAKISTGCFEHFIIAEIGEESNETFAEKVHKVIKRFATAMLCIIVISSVNAIATVSVGRFCIGNKQKRDEFQLKLN